MRRIAIGAAAAALWAAGAGAQSISVEDLRAQIDERLTGLNEYEALLQDPDPARSMAAMEIMIGSGDPALERMALDHGLYSPNPAVRAAALTAFFGTMPVLEIRLDGAEVEDKDFVVQMNKRGSVGRDKVGVWSVRVGAFDPEQACFIWHGFTNCAVRVNENSVLVNLTDNWARGALGEDGVVSGDANIDYIDDPVPFAFAVGD